MSALAKTLVKQSLSEIKSAVDDPVRYVNLIARAQWSQKYCCCTCNPFRCPNDPVDCPHRCLDCPLETTALKSADDIEKTLTQEQNSS